jgi:FkbM family methyltransferase
MVSPRLALVAGVALLAVFATVSVLNSFHLTRGSRLMRGVGADADEGVLRLDETTKRILESIVAATAKNTATVERLVGVIGAGAGHGAGSNNAVSKAAVAVAAVHPATIPGILVRATGSWCVDTGIEYGVRPGSTWGTLPTSTQGAWRSRGCDDIMNHHLMEAHSARTKQGRPSYVRPSNIKRVAASDPAAASCTAGERSALHNKGMPASLLRAGLELFGSCHSLVGVVARISEPEEFAMVFGSAKSVLRALGSDSTLKELHHEMKTDRYGLLDIGNTLPSAVATSGSPGLIVDVGANIGDFSICGALMHPSVQVLAFEPSAETYFLVLWNLAANGIPALPLSDLGVAGRFGVVALHGALSEDGQPIRFFHNPTRSQISSVAKPGQALPSGYTETTIPAFSLSLVLETAGVEKVHLFKIDCEGCEVRRGAERMEPWWCREPWPVVVWSGAA